MTLSKYLKWLTPGIGIKRWLTLALMGVLCSSFALTGILDSISFSWDVYPSWLPVSLLLMGLACVVGSLLRLLHNLLAPYRQRQVGNVVDVVVDHNKRGKGVHVVAIGGGTGLPTTLRGLKAYTNNITAIVTVADDGGSSGRLRRDMGVLPPGDLRNNIVALADDESLMARLFQYRFESGELKGHAFGNLFIAALASIAEQEGHQRNSLAVSLVETERVLNIQGRVLPSTLDDAFLEGTIQLEQSERLIKVRGEAQIGEVKGKLLQISLEPSTVKAYPDSVQSILEADLIVIGPGSLYTSILPNLLVQGIADALRATKAYKIYVCNVATQPVETDGYTVADHVIALEKHIGRGVFQAVLANHTYPTQNAGQNTHYVMPSDTHHEILQRYEVRYTDLTDEEQPWRHHPDKLAKAIWGLRNAPNDAPVLNT